MSMWVIHWDDTANTYLHGSKVQFLDDGKVFFSNPMIPSGEVLNAWFSATNYQRQRIEPTLPLLKNAARYRISLNAKTNGQGSLLLQLLFYNRFGAEISQVFIRKGQSLFSCPQGTYSYRINLIDGGVTDVEFESIVIEEDEQESE